MHQIITMRLLLSFFLIHLFQIAYSQHQHQSGNGYADSVNRGIITKDTLKSSPKRVSMETIADTHIHIEYGSPGVKGRMIWGGLVAYDQVWATGAHNATTVDFSNDVTIGGKNIPKGKYALFTIPGKDEWTVIINSRNKQHLADEYNPAEDLVRVKVKPIKKDKMVQRLTYSVTGAGKKAVIAIEWEYLSINLPVTVS